MQKRKLGKSNLARIGSVALNRVDGAGRSSAPAVVGRIFYFNGRACQDRRL